MKPRKPRKQNPNKHSDVVRSKTDEYGNSIIAKDNGVRLIITLKLVKETRYRRLGNVNLKNKTLNIKRTREKHLFHKSKAYGFNFHFLEGAKRFDKVRLEDNYDECLIPVKDILSKGLFLHFLAQGFEKQIFMKLDTLEEYKRKPKY
jgi:hypothetical protein